MSSNNNNSNARDPDTSVVIPIPRQRLNPFQLISRFEALVESLENNVPTSALTPHVPIFGHRLRPFSHQWQNITTTKWIIEVVTIGYSIPFLSLPPSYPPTHPPCLSSGISLTSNCSSKNYNISFYWEQWNSCPNDTEGRGFIPIIS